MPWVVTLKVTDCSTHALLPGASISDGVVTYYTDVNGQFIAIIADEYDGYIVVVGKASYYSKNFAMYRSTMAGTTQEVCLNAAPPPPPSSGGGGW